MCEAKVNIPFLKQEIILNEAFPLYDIKIPYQDQTLMEDLVWLNLPNSMIQIKDKVSIDVSDQICDYGDHLEANGILKLDDLVAGPYQTEGGVVQFRRLYIHLKNIQIPIKIYYEYNQDALCDIGKQDISENLIQDMSGIIMKPPFEIVLDNSNNLIFDKFFVTNGLNETNMNMIFNRLEPQFKEIQGLFRPIYQSYVKVLEKTKMNELVKKEMNRILCLYKNKTPKSTDITPIYYKEKIERLKIQGNWNVIFKN